MAQGLNKVQLIGNLGQDPELKTTNGGSQVCNFSIATSEQWTDRDGQRQERTEWHRIQVWGASAEACSRYLVKGSQVYVEGSIQTREYEDRSGNKRKATEIKAARVLFLSGGQNGGGGRGRDGGPPPYDEPPGRDDDGDGIPF